MGERPALPSAVSFVPACVVYTTKGGPRKQQQQQQEEDQEGGVGQREGPPKAYYLVGQWPQVQVDPSVWGFGAKLGVLDYTVKAATQRLLQFQCRRLRGWVPSCGMRPRIWREHDGSLNPAGALQQREAGQKRRFDARMEAGFTAGSSPRFSPEDVAAGTHANWMDPSPPRQHPLQRVAEALGAVTSQRAQQHLLHVSQPAVDDTEDPLTRGLQPPAEEEYWWVAAYRRVQDKRLPKSLRVLGWQILHAAVYTGSERVRAARSPQELLGCCCHQPQCWPQPPQPPPPQQQQQGFPQQQQQQQQQPAAQQQQQQQQQGVPQQQHQHQPAAQQQQQPEGPAGAGGPPPLPGEYQLESLSHLFVDCPGIRAAWQWFEGVWGRVQPGAGVDCSDVRVLLLDDGSVWQPPKELLPLWTHLRLLMLESIWSVRCSSSGQPYSSRQVVSRFLAVLQQQMQHDWARTQGDIRLDSGVPLSWLRGRSPVMSRDRFNAKWLAEGAVYIVEEGGGLLVSLPHLAGH